MKNRFTIGQAAKEAGVRIQTLHYYERERLLAPTTRSRAGYRLYGVAELKRVRFIRQAQELGFSLQEIKELLNLRAASVNRCEKVRKKAADKLSSIQTKLQHLKALEKTLRSLIRSCERNEVSEGCPILERMEVDL